MNIGSSLSSSFFYRMKAQKKFCFVFFARALFSVKKRLSLLSLKVLCLSFLSSIIRVYELLTQSLKVLCLSFLSSIIRVYELLTQSLKVLCFFCLLLSPAAHAVKISFPDEELATESVLPLADSPEKVLNRNINLKWKVEVNVSSGVGLDEPFYFPLYPMGSLSFHFSEVHSISLLGIYYRPDLSSTGNSLKEGTDIDKTFDAKKAPYPQMSAFLNYQYSPFYGKVSLSKALNLNLSIYGFTGLGLVISNQNDRFPAVNFGIGQKLYITKWLGLRADIAFYGYYGPAVEKLDLGDSVKSVSYGKLQPDQKKVNLNILSIIGVSFLL